MTKSLPLIIPVENQVRELDPKLLLAITAVKAGLTSFIGYRTEIDINIAKLPRSIYLAKSFTQRSDKMFRILSKLGHIICAWDEEALVHYPADVYFTRRLSARSLGYISHLFAWGEENVKLFKSYPHFPENLPVYKVGNPRLDLLRDDFISYYQKDIDKTKAAYGEFILINTNFGNVNAHLPMHNLFLNKDSSGNYKNMGRGSKGMKREFAQGRAKFKQKIFEEFLQLIPEIANSFKTTTIIIRPHPVENKQVYNQLASKFNNVQVVQKGNVIPWIRAAKAVIHSGCTTGIEAYLCKQPAISFVPVTDPYFGYDALLPDQLSNRCTTKMNVIENLELYLNATPPIPNSVSLKDYIEFDDDGLCCQNIVDILQQIDHKSRTAARTVEHTHGWFLANKRKIIKRTKSLLPGSKYHTSFQEVRFPSIDENLLRKKVTTFSNILHLNRTPTVNQVSPHIFLVQ